MMISVADLGGKKLGVLLTVGPTHPHFPAAVALMEAALKLRVRVYLYCIDDAVWAVDAPSIQALKDSGVNLFACAYGAGKRKIALSDRAAWSGLTVVSDIIGSTDRFISI